MKTKRLIFSVTIVSLMAVAAFPQKAKIQSVYTSLDAKDCKTLESETEGAGWYRGECRGVGGYKLQLTEGDIRQSIDVIAPNKKKYELDFIGNISSGFSAVGLKAEWRVAGSGKSVSPIALIARFNVSENPEDSTKTTSYLIVSKITKDEICIIDIVKPMDKQNEKARELADSSAAKPCFVREN